MGRTRHASVDAWVADAPGHLRGLLQRLRALVLETAPAPVEETIKWGHPSYGLDGDVCYLAAYTEHVNLGFYGGSAVADPASLLEGTGKRLRHVKFRPGEPFPEVEIRALLTEAFAAVA